MMVNFSYNGVWPKVTWNISWRRFFKGIWQNIKDFMHQAWKRRNVYLLNTYTLIALCATLVVVFCLIDKAFDYATTFGGRNMFSNFWGAWSSYISGEFGIINIVHQVGVLVLLLAAIMLFNTPASEWWKSYMSLSFDDTLSDDIKEKLLIRRADSMVESVGIVVTWTSGLLIITAAVTAIVWVVWTML